MPAAAPLPVSQTSCWTLATQSPLGDGVAFTSDWSQMRSAALPAAGRNAISNANIGRRIGLFLHELGGKQHGHRAAARILSQYGSALQVLIQRRESCGGLADIDHRAG
jgi:hypothetical protein